ncbi:hypothetical protein QBC36DRAFT_199700 [Triangularia setosa]|uniref:Zn(2)-C6 fungal-type domain-containing protein n=1 Tax=Triangularia setosa TaxID=2587417 RepID=A0AAN6W043_9PEZI|nr:hypothetical protein QBC36DRAFT_199700 [Podospora setosa]
MDVTKPDPDAEGVVMQQSYPSPMVDSADAQYYQLANHREHDAQMAAHQGGQDVPGGLPNLSAHQEHQEHHDHQDHHDLHELQELQEPATPQQHDSRAQVSADELQLAAQLTQGLTQGMNQMMAPADMAAVEGQVQEQQPLPQQLGEDHQQHQQQPEVQPQSVPNLQEQLEASLQNHERELQNQNHNLQNQNHEHELQDHNHELQGHEHELQAHNHELQNHDLQVQNVMPHHEQAQTQHHFPQNPPPPPHLPAHLSMDHMPNVHPTYQMPDNTPPRKRSKVSRACDECRRKKIKCDAQSEASEQACSNCRRSSAQCLFSRVPQKRGPSKGYIKELADRINSIEGKLNSNVTADGSEDTARRSSSEAFASPVLGDDSRKRPFSSISADPYAAAGSPNRIPSTYGTEHRPILPYVHPDFRPPNPASANDLALKTMPPLPTFPVGNELGLQSHATDGLMDSISPSGTGGPIHPPDQQQQQLPEIDDGAFDKYLEAIHPTFPVLASTKARVQSLVWQASFALQNAFHQAFFAMIRPFSPEAPAGDMMIASRLLSAELAQGGRSPPEDLLTLQGLIMLIIASDCQGVSGGVTRWKNGVLGQAVGLGWAMGLHTRRVSDELELEGLDPNSDDNVALRAWWVLVMLDRWEAVGKGRPTFMPNDTVAVLPGLRFVVGEVVWDLIRLSHVLGFLNPSISFLRGSLDHFASSPSVVMAENYALMASEMVRLAFPTGAATAAPVIHMAYWHVQILRQLLTTSRPPQRVLEACKSLVSLLANNHELVCPLTHHFLTLVGVALVELCKLEETEEQAMELVGYILEYRIASSTWNEQVRRKLERVRRERGGREKTLQQLADLATGINGQGQRSRAWIAAEETGRVLGGGYLAFWENSLEDRHEEEVDEHSQQEEHQEHHGEPQQRQPQPQEAEEGEAQGQEDVIMHNGQDPGQVQSQEDQESAAHAAAAAAVAAINNAGLSGAGEAPTLPATTAESMVLKAEQQLHPHPQAEAENPGADIGLGLQMTMGIAPPPPPPAAV